jgi:radical SAM superfamily enzyme YgiQ (UPF0313 family)
LVMPGVGRKPGEPYVNSWKMEPLAPAVLAAMTPADVEVRFLDDRLEPIPYDEPTDAVAINVETYTARRAYAIAARFRQRGVPVILGGYHPTLVPQEAEMHAESIVEGEAETVWPRMIEDLRSRRLQRRYRGEGETPARASPRRSIFTGKKYLPMTLIEAGRGCCFACEFCSVAEFYRHTASARPVEDVLAEIEQASRRTVFFIDDNIVANPNRAKRMFKAIASAGIRWVSQGSITMADDPEMLALMRKSGCRNILIGFESLSTATLVAMGKTWNCAQRDYEDAIRRIRDAGIAVYATFVFGYDTDDADAFDRTVEFAIRQKFHLAAFNHLVPFPGTPLYRRLQDEGRLRFDAWWLDPRYRFGDVAFHPRNMSAEELADRCFEARNAFYRFSSIVARARDLKSNCRDLYGAASYFWLNLFSGREMQKRQGLPLGEGFDDEDDCPLLNPATSGSLLEGVA